MSQKVLVVLGGGTMGVDIAASFAVYGWKTIVVNPPDERGKTIIERFNAALTRLKKTAQTPVQVVQTMADAPWPTVDLVIEAVPEKLDLKRQIFAELERLAPADIPLCSNSSALPISAIADGLKTESRMVGTHYFMPAHLVPGVEVVCSDKTDVAVADQVAAYMRSVGKGLS